MKISAKKILFSLLALTLLAAIAIPIRIVVGTYYSIPYELRLIEHKDIERIKKLLSKKKFNLNAKDYCGFGVLDYAVITHDINIVELLIKNGANVNAKSNAGASPLNRAVKHREEAIVQLLIRSGADVNNTTGAISPIHSAITHEWSDETINLFLNNGANRQNLVFDLVFWNNSKGLKRLLTLRPDTDLASKNERGYTPLMFAIKEGSYEVIKLLISLEVPVNSLSSEGKTALDIAIGKGDQEVIDLLKNKGAKTATELKTEKQDKAK